MTETTETQTHTFKPHVTLLRFLHRSYFYDLVLHPSIIIPVLFPFYIP